MVRKPGRALSMTTAAAVVVLALSGCGVFERPLEEPLRTKTARLLAPRAEIDAAMERAVSACAKKHGWTERVEFSLPHPGLISGIPEVFASAESAEKRGYASTLRQSSGVNAGLTPEQEEAILGRAPQGKPRGSAHSESGAPRSVPATGCVAESAAAVFGSVENANTVSELSEEMKELPRETSRHTARVSQDVSDAYRGCMRQGGYDLHLGAASGHANQMWGAYRSPGEPPHEQELQMLRVDIGCQAELDIARRLDDAILLGAAGWARKNEARIMKAAELIEAATERSKRILGE
ncbi:hypothetical protein [Arthrobacter sp. UM1]|uniref:hypothetical protein n=1 Tax=Arthrobacter sp. UM1 TaxID=2766776 RepID=UPI001CF637D2|nr:hypothetical protein [Arthrobacter sp. UM1]MCB4208886.1 hypothetical protein [Arthrobacter sp. UM1]